MDKIKIVKMIDADGKVFGVNQDGGDVIIRSKTVGWTGNSFQLARIDPSTFSLNSIDVAHHEIHVGHAFSVCHYEADFDKVDVIGVLFTTPDTLKYVHMFAIVYASSASLFEICEAPTLDTDEYPTTFRTPINRERNSSNTSRVLSVRAVPVVNKLSLKVVANASPVTADGTVIHAEMIGASKQGGGSGVRDNNEYVLKRNTIYYFRLSGTAGGADNSVGSIVLDWYEHADLEV